VDQSKFQEAQQAYEAGDFRTAAKSFLASAGKGAAGNGSAYHMAGNALMRLRRYQDAVTVYGHALRDETYDKRGSVQANLGAAYVALGEYAEAVKAYEAAIEEPDYPTPYRAFQGMAAALVERGKIEDAAIAYRRAALDQANPDPGKALVNLGLCFMALGRPEDAVEAYQAALGFDDYQGRGKALANLGQAYAAMGEYDEAVRAFEKATQMHSHPLSPTAQQAYDDALAARPRRETVEGWETGQMPAPMEQAAPTGWDAEELQALADDTVADAEPELAGRADEAAAALGMGDEEAVTEFFAMTEDEMKARDREARRIERERKRSSGSWAKIVATIVAVVLVAVALLGALYWLGYGWPTQASTVDGLVAAYAAGQPVERYWVAVPGKDVAREMAKIPSPVKTFAIDSVDRGRATSTAYVTVTPEKGAPLRYTITLSREGVGWKVTGVENDWSSTGG
jgi:tetratricopeptide (TPR) repeat protein